MKGVRNYVALNDCNIIHHHVGKVSKKPDLVTFVGRKIVVHVSKNHSLLLLSSAVAAALSLDDVFLLLKPVYHFEVPGFKLNPGTES